MDGATTVVNDQVRVKVDICMVVAYHQFWHGRLTCICCLETGNFIGHKYSNQKLSRETMLDQIIEHLCHTVDRLLQRYDIKNFGCTLV